MRQQENPVLACGHCREYEVINRRTFLQGAPRSLAGLLFSAALERQPAWMPRIALADPHVGPRGDTLVCIFLRGGADGLNLIVPHGEEAYYNLRPTLAIARPDDARANQRSIDLDGFFGLHPALAALEPIYQAGDLAMVHAVGSPHGSRSHFEAMAFMERGLVDTGGDYSGWLARHLLTLDTGNESPLRAVAINDMLPLSLAGTDDAVAVPSIDGYRLSLEVDTFNDPAEALASMYQQHGGLLAIPAQQTLSAIEILQSLGESYQPRGRAYPEGEFGMGMQAISRLIRADVGVEVACIDLGGWDTHALQGAGEGHMPGLMAELAEGLAAFYEDTVDHASEISVVVMSEFGRRAKENAARGTDHGYGSAMLLMGGGISGGHVYGRWPGLDGDQLADPGDLDITTDYRDILAEIVVKRLSNPLLAEVFPGYTPGVLGVATPRSAL